MQAERVLVAGAGGIGTILGGFLRRAGHSVALLGRPAHLEVIARRGLCIDGIWGEHHVEGFELATSPCDLSGNFAAILITVKSYDTRSMAEAVLPFLRPDGVMISMQNGLGNVEIIEDLTGPERGLGARVIFGATLPEPGCARVTVFADPNALGALRPGLHPRRDELARYWASALDSAGIPTIYSERLEAMLWAKVFYNAALNPLSALLNVHYGALPERADSRALMNAAIGEAFAVATAEGVELPWPTADAYRKEFYERLVPVTFDHRSSMLQDLERGRQTEIDAINGEVWRRACAHGIVTPVNEVLTRLVRLFSPPRSPSTPRGT
jgi:2-dehydropantoate 2-reductase